VNCEQVRQLLDAYVDDELDVVRCLELEEHLESCEACAAASQELRQLHRAFAGASLYHEAPKRLRHRIQAALPRERTAVPKLQWNSAWLAIAAGVVLAVLWIRPAGDTIGPEVVSSHVRSLMADHLTDIPSSDQHTVKPWFTGKLDFSPDVRDFAPQGFPLVGGRLDYIEGRAVPALVYTRRQHRINVFIWPGKTEAQARQKSARNGYQVLHWLKGGMNYWVVSDLNAVELEQFADLLTGTAH
jgi:anti-sigma factor RsiW